MNSGAGRGFISSCTFYAPTGGIMNTNNINEPRDLPIIALRGMTMLPDVYTIFSVERKQSLAALKAASDNDYDIFLVSQKDAEIALPTKDDLNSVGVVCHITSVTNTGGKVRSVSVVGLYAATISEIYSEEPYFRGSVVPLKERPIAHPNEVATLKQACLNLIRENASLFNAASPINMLGLISANDPGVFSHKVAQTLDFFYYDKQEILEQEDPETKISLTLLTLGRMVKASQYERELLDLTNERMNRSQHEYYLREQMKVIQQELGEDDDEEIDEYIDKINELKLSDDNRKKLLKEVQRLQKQPFGSSEASVMRSYLDTCIELPWGIKTCDETDINAARKQLDNDHFGLQKVKERIVEYLAVRSFAPEVGGALLCLVGPPGTGKTSIALSIAKALGRKSVRISLGGVDDEAEIRGHRKTYIGSMPGRIIAGIRNAGSSNPVMILDEIDKMGANHKGDPASALLEVLDPEQNKNFRDNYLELPYDLSDVFFIATANTVDTIPRALLDRMEIIELSSYTDEEKLSIAKNYLVPKQRKKHGLKATQLKISDDAIREIMTLYTRESGVRNLERSIASLCRKAVVIISDGTKKSVTVRSGALQQYLGSPKFKPEQQRKNDTVGLVRGLAWTSAGGEVLDVEAAVVPGSGKLELTGNLGDVMKESCHAALTYIRCHADMLGIDKDFQKNKDIHLHFPEGAVPKDGPSAGITVCIALISALGGCPVRHNVAMTGEISLRGRVMAIGGLKEKTMAAMRNGIETVIIPSDNEPDLDEIDPVVRNALNFVCVDCVDKALPIALVPISDGKSGEVIVSRPHKKTDRQVGHANA